MLTRVQLETHIGANRTIRQISELETTSFTNIRYWLAKYGLRTKGRQVGQSTKKHKCVCGQKDPKQFYGHQKVLCKGCHQTKTIKRQRDNKQKARNWLGGKCVHCNFDKFQVALDIHHLDPGIKDPNFNRSASWSWERVQKELVDCVLLCRNCHMAYHAGLLTEVDLSLWKSASMPCNKDGLVT